MNPSRRDGDEPPEDWQDLADDEAWDTLPGERKPWRRAREAERAGQDRDAGAAGEPTTEWDEDDWADEDDWEDEDGEARDDEPEPRGWQDPSPRRKRSVLTSLILLPFRLLALPFKIAFWAVVISIVWVAAYTVVNPPSWTYLDVERDRLGKATVIWKDMDEISPHLVRAVIAAEDARFCAHWGVDMEATEAAIEDYLAGGRIIGASTLTQQTAKNVFLWHDRTWLRKVLEVPFALAMEVIWGKRRIVEVYLNVAEFDTGTFGAEAAAQGYFNKPAKDLTLAEASRLAAVLPDPKDRSAARPGDYTARQARRIADGAQTLERTGRDDCVEEGSE